MLLVATNVAVAGQKSAGVRRVANRITPAPAFAADALLAADATLRVVVPRSTTGGELSDEQIHRNVAAMDREMTSTPPSSTLTVVYVRASIGYGCTCTPFVFDMSLVGDNDQMWPHFAHGVPEMPRVHGDFRLAGRFESKRKSGYELQQRRAPKQPAENDALINTGRVFEVTGWCYQPFDYVNWYEAQDVAEMLANGRICKGSDVGALRRNLAKAERERRANEGAK